MNKEAKTKEKKTLTKGEVLAKYRATLMVLQMRNKMGHLVQTHQIKQIKKEIARLLTKNK